MFFQLQELIKTFPEKSGVYQFLDKSGKILYVGKAKNLKKRVKAYLNPINDKRIQIPKLMEKAVDCKFIITTNEKEALLLENNLIKENKPDYNICLKDDKTYKTICITIRDEFPKISTIRKYDNNSKDLYFGPYTGAKELKKAIHQLIKLFQIRDCNDNEFKRHVKLLKPCLKYQIGNCSGPCASLINKENYKISINKAISFLNGNTNEVMLYFKDLINVHSSKLEFEKADNYYKKLQLLQTFEKSQIFVNGYHKDADAISVFNHNNLFIFQVFIIRKGKIISGFEQIFNDKNGSINEIMSSFIEQFYINKRSIPPEIWVNEEPLNKGVLSEVLSEIQHSKVIIKIPKTGSKFKIIQMAEQNAQSKLILFNKNNIEKEKLQSQVAEIFNNKDIINRIECYDISHTGGHEAVGSKVSFINFDSDKKNYRLYKIKNKIINKDDLSSLYEILKRRFTKEIMADSLPDLILIDGGLLQLSVLRKVLNEFNLNIKALGIVKETHSKSSRDKIFIENRKNPLNIKPELMKKFMFIRDEAHRFALKLHKKRRENKLFS